MWLLKHLASSIRIMTSWKITLQNYTFLINLSQCNCVKWKQWFTFVRCAMTSDDCETNRRNQMKSHYNEQDTINYTVNCQMLIIIRIFFLHQQQFKKWIRHFIPISGRGKFNPEIKRTHILMSFSILHSNRFMQMNWLFCLWKMSKWILWLCFIHTICVSKCKRLFLSKGVCDMGEFSKKEKNELHAIFTVTSARQPCPMHRIVDKNSCTTLIYLSYWHIWSATRNENKQISQRLCAVRMEKLKVDRIESNEFPYKITFSTGSKRIENTLEVVQSFQSSEESKTKHKTVHIYMFC